MFCSGMDSRDCSSLHSTTGLNERQRNKIGRGPDVRQEAIILLDLELNQAFILPGWIDLDLDVGPGGGGWF